MRTKTVQITPEVRAVLSRCSYTTNAVVLPPEQLDRPLYEAVDKALKAAGGKWNRSLKAHVFPDGTDPRKVFAEALDKGEVVDTKKTLQAFYTPEALAKHVVEQARVHSGQTVLEPSAGHGALAMAARARGAKVMCVEVDQAACKRLDDLGFDYACSDFLDFPSTRKRYDRVVMNPPFTGGQDLEHVSHALRFVAPGGVLAAIMPASVKTAESRAHRAFRERLDKAAADWKIDDLPDGSFAESGTQVNTVLLVVTFP